MMCCFVLLTTLLTFEGIAPEIPFGDPIPVEEWAIGEDPARNIFDAVVLEDILWVERVEEGYLYHYQLHDPRYQWTKPPQPVAATYYPCFTLVARRR